MEEQLAPPPCERVLVVDDDEDFADTIREVLEMHGVEVAVASSLERARAVLDGDFGPRLVLVDLRLRGELGEEVIAGIRRHPRFRDVPVVAMSGDLHKLRALDTADGKLGKPFRLPELLKTLEELC